MRLLVILLVFLIPSGILAQSVNGQVFGQTSESTDPLIGASVYFSGTSTGVFTDDAGKFELEIPEGHSTLIVSFIGFVSIYSCLQYLTIINYCFPSFAIRNNMIIFMT